MAPRRYENFDLLIEEEPGGYQARVTACPSNETPSTRFVLPFDATKLENLLLKLDPGRSDMRRSTGDAGEVASRELGGALYSAVFTEDIRDAWTAPLDQVQARDCGLRLRLKLTDAPSLAGLPWELLYSARTNRYPAQSESTPVIRFLGDRGASKALRVAGPLTILFVICSPTDLPDLDTENEWRAVQQELKPHHRPWRRPPGATSRPGDARAVAGPAQRRSRAHRPLRGARRLRREHPGRCPLLQFRVLDQGRHRRRSTRVRAAGRRGPEARRPQRLPLRARGLTRFFGGMAQGLVQFSVSAVAAMQFPISDKAASTFSRSLYRAIARGNPIDQAIAGARKAILMAYLQRVGDSGPVPQNERRRPLRPAQRGRRRQCGKSGPRREAGPRRRAGPRGDAWRLTATRGAPPSVDGTARDRRALAIGAAVVVILVAVWVGLQYYIFREALNNFPTFTSATSPSVNYFSALSGPAVDAHRFSTPPVWTVPPRTGRRTSPRSRATTSSRARRRP